jgi:hypothetical protein
MGYKENKEIIFSKTFSDFKIQYCKKRDIPNPYLIKDISNPYLIKDISNPYLIKDISNPYLINKSDKS